MKILVCSSGTGVEMSKVQQSIAKRLYKELDGAYSLIKKSNLSEVESTILYQIPQHVSDYYNLPKDVRDEVNVMDVLISTASYADKVRIEIIERSPEEKTIAFRSFKAKDFENVQKGVQKVVDYIKFSIREEFSKYEVLF